MVKHLKFRPHLGEEKRLLTYVFVIFLSSFFFASKRKAKKKKKHPSSTCHINDTIASDVKIALDSELPRRRCCRPGAQSDWAGGARRLSDGLENTGRARCPLLLFLCFVLFFKFTAPLFNFSVSLAGPSLPSPFAKKHKPCLWVRLPGPCLDSAGQATVCPRYSESSAGTASGGGLRRGYPPKKTAPPGGGGGPTPPCPGPRFAFSLLLSPRLLPSPQSRPLHCLLFYITHFYSPRFPARTFSLRVSPPELCGGAARADSFDLGAVHVVEIRGPAALPSRRSRNGALARENKPLFSGAFFVGLDG